MMLSCSLSHADEHPIALIKILPEFGNVSGNLAKLERLTRQAADAGAKVGVYGEGAVDGYISVTKAGAVNEKWCRPNLAIDNGVACRNVDLVAQSDARKDIVNKLIHLSSVNQIYIVFTIPTKAAHGYGVWSYPKVVDTLIIAV